jgi:hypothetical protein
MIDDRHPEELLAGYVDGTLTEDERAVVESHVSACERCRAESGLARRAVGVLHEIPEEPVPFGVMNPVVAEIGRRMRRTSARPLSQRVVWAAGGAIAAAFVGIVAVWLLPGIAGRGAANDSAAGGRAAAEAAAPQATAAGGAATFGGAPVVLERRSTDYDDDALAALATETAAALRSGTMQPTSGERTDAEATESATRCLSRRAGPEPQDVLVRLIAARYRGSPAYVGVYATSPAPERAPNSVVVWVVNADTCAIENITTKRI